MSFASQEDRLNPKPPPDADEATVGGYAAIHGRAATFEGVDGAPYSVAIEIEASPREGGPGSRYGGYFVFLRWSEQGNAVLDHVETDDIVSGGDEAEVRKAMAAISLHTAKAALDEAVRRKREAGRFLHE